MEIWKTFFGDPKERRRSLAVAAGALVVACMVVLASPATGDVEPRAIEVRIDIKPGDESTTITPGRGGILPVAIYSDAAFDATRIDADSIRFGPTGAEARPQRVSAEDVDADERLDMIALFQMSDTSIGCDDTVAHLKGRTLDGEPIEGSAEFKTAECGR